MSNVQNKNSKEEQIVANALVNYMCVTYVLHIKDVSLIILKLQFAKP